MFCLVEQRISKAEATLLRNVFACRGSRVDRWHPTLRNWRPHWINFDFDICQILKFLDPSEDSGVSRKIASVSILKVLLNSFKGLSLRVKGYIFHFSLVEKAQIYILQF